MCLSASRKRQCPNISGVCIRVIEKRLDEGESNGSSGSIKCYTLRRYYLEEILYTGASAPNRSSRCNTIGVRCAV